MKKNPQNKAKNIETIIRLAWSSLESHLEYTYKGSNKKDRKFHKNCVIEYAEIIKNATSLY